MATIEPTQEDFSQHAPLRILIIGGGICGLGTAIALRLAGHEATIFEAAKSFEEVGAGLQITPNGTRILQRWGVHVESVASKPSTFAINRYDGKSLAFRDHYDEELQRRHGAPLWCIHRADLQKALAERAAELGVNIALASRAVDVDTDQGSILLDSSKRVNGDLIIAADGIWSETRKHLFDDRELSPSPLPTGHLAYRALVDCTSFRGTESFHVNGINIWVGPGAHAVAYSLQDRRLINLVLLVKDDLPSDAAKMQGNLEEMHVLFQDWDPALVEILKSADTVSKWRLNYLPPIPRWSTPNGRFLAVGDCVHAMLPYMAQGANSALEDAGTIGALLQRVRGRGQLKPAIALYNAIRGPRIEQLVKETFLQGIEHHLPDGEQQRQRDMRLCQSTSPEHSASSRDPWTHPKIQPWLYGYDSYEAVATAFAECPY